MDFEDFEFKPLTEGLGFHKKTTSKKTEELPPLEPKSELKEKFSSSFDKLNSNSLQFDSPFFSDSKAKAPVAEPKIELPEFSATSSSNLFSKPLPRTEKDIEKKPAQPITAIPKFNPRFGKPLSNPSIHDSKIQETGLLPILEAKNSTVTAADISKTQIKSNKVDTTLEIKYIEVAPSPLSLFLDLTVIAGLTILFMLGLVVATGLDLVPILSNADTGTQFGMALLAYSVSQLYLILARSFFGQTLGEWSMDTQLGLPGEQQKINYAFKLIARTLILTATGFIILPIASMIMKKDITGRAVDLKLYTK